MDVARDIRTLEEFKQDTTGVIRDLRTHHRPMVITSKGEPEMVIIPASLLRGKLKALKAACELATT